MTDTNWVLEWLKVSLLWLLYYVVHYLCWVRYPPRDKKPPSRWTEEFWDEPKVR
jgi:hypothetical protein